MVDGRLGLLRGGLRRDGQPHLEVPDPGALARRDVAAGLVNRNSRAGFAAEHRVHRLARMLAGDVPKRVVDRGERHREQAPPPVEERGGVHLIPEPLHVARVRPHDEVPQVAMNDLDRGATSGAHAEAHDALVRLDHRDDRRRQLLERATVVPASRILVRRERRRVEEAHRALVDVHRIGVHGHDDEPAGGISPHVAARRPRRSGFVFRSGATRGRGKRRQRRRAHQELPAAGRGVAAIPRLRHSKSPMSVAATRVFCCGSRQMGEDQPRFWTVSGTSSGGGTPAPFANHVVQRQLGFSITRT